MEKLNLQRDREDFYIIEVNEKGDTITFDLTDIGLPEKILKASDNIKKLDTYLLDLCKSNNNKCLYYKGIAEIYK